jgi:hypothetical protein
MAAPSHSEMHAFNRARLERLAARPNTTVLDVAHDVVAEPWAAARLRPVMERVVGAALAHGDDVDDFAVRKAGLADPEALAFQRRHPQLYWLLTDRRAMREPRLRGVVTQLLGLRDRVERGELADGPDADALATQTVVGALGGAPGGA